MALWEDLIASPFPPPEPRLRVVVDVDHLGALVEHGPCRAARETYVGLRSGDPVDIATAHPLAAEHACPYCDAIRLLQGHATSTTAMYGP